MVILRKFNLIILIVIALVAGTLSVVDFFDLATISPPNYPLLTLFLLSMVGIHLIVSHFSQEDFLESTKAALEKISKEANSDGFTVFNDSKEIESYLANRLLEAKKSVCDLTWKSTISEGFSASSRQLAHTYMDKCIAEASDRISYREIFIFNDPRRVDKLERRLAENKRGYSCKYFKDDTPIPRLQFVIVDDEEIFFFASSADSILCSSKNPELVKVLKSYYEAAWNAAITIKSGPNINNEQVTFVRSIR